MRKPSPAKLADVVRRQLTDDLRRAPYKGNENPMAGHCYVASEALYHLLGGKQSPWVPQYVHHEGSPHWFLKHKGTGEVLDATSEQFKTKVPYHASVGKGFLTRDPSARARTVIQAVHAVMPGQLAKAERDLKQVASIAAFNADGMLLFGRRNDNGKWTLPGGHFEPGEDKSKAAVRELYEETGLTPVGMRYLGAKPGGRNGEVLVHAFAASVKGEVSFQNDPDQEFAEAKWVNPQAIPSEIMDNLHNPKNVTLQLLGIQEDLVKAEGDMPKPPEPPKPDDIRSAYENPALRKEVLKRPDVPDDLRKLAIEQGHARSVFNDNSRGVSNDVIEHAINHSKESRDALAGWYGHDDGKNAKMTEDQTRRFLLLADGEQLRNFGNASRPHLRDHFSKPENIEHFLVNMKDDMYRPLTGPAQLRTRLEENPELAHKLLFGESSKHPNRAHVADLLSGTQDTALLDKMLEDHDPEVASAALGSDKLTPEQLEPFADKPEHAWQLLFHPSATDDQFNRAMPKISESHRKLLPVLAAQGMRGLAELNQKLAANPPESRDAVKRMEYAKDRTVALAHRLSAEHLDKLLDNDLGYSDSATLMQHPNVSDESLKRLADKNTTSGRIAMDVLGNRNPDLAFDKKVAVKLGTSKLRQIRDAILESGRQTAHKKEFADKGVDLTPFTIPGTANVSAEKLQQHVDNLQPHATYNVSEDVWNGGQRHSDEKSKVFQLNLTTDLINKMKQEGVYDTFKQMHEASRSSGHPVHQKHGLGWVRYTQGSAPQDGARDDFYEPEAMAERLANGDYDAKRPNQTPETGKGQPDKDHFFIDEIQSDFGQDFARNILTNTVNQHRRDGEEQGLEGEELEDYVREREEETAKEVGARYPQEHVEKINNILFGGKYANEVLAEAFLQHLRDKGHAGSEVRIHHANTKAPLAQLQVRDDGSPHKKWIDTKNGNKTQWREADEGEPDEAQKQAFLAAGIKPVDDIPRVHMETYGTMPKKVLGMRPTTYGELATESNRNLHGKATWGDKLHKAEKFSDHYNYEDEPALHQPEDEVDRMLQHPDPSERFLALAHPNITEDNLIRHLHNSANPVAIYRLLKHPEAKERFQNFAYGYFGSPLNASSPGQREIIRRSTNSKALLDWAAQHDEKGGADLLANPHASDEHKLAVMQRPDAHKQDYMMIPSATVAKMSPKVMNEYIKYSLAHPRGSLHHSLLASPMLDDEALNMLASNNKYANAVADNPNFKLEHALKAAPYAHERFISSLAQVHPEYLKHPELARHLLNGSTVRDAIGHGVGTPEQLHDIARHAQDYHTVAAVLKRPDANAEHLKTVLNHNHNFDASERESLAADFLEDRNRSPEDVLQALPHVDAGYSQIDAIRRHGDKFSPEQNARALDAIKGDKEFFIKRAHLPKEAQLKLVDSDDPETVRSLAANEHLHPEAIDRILDKPSPNLGAIAEAVTHPQFTENHHQKMVAKGLLGNEDVASNVALYSRSPERVQAALSHHPDSPDVHANALRNTYVKLPHDTLLRIIDLAAKHNDDYASIRDAVLKLPAEHHSALSDHKSSLVRDSVAEHTNDPETLSKLAQDSSSTVRNSAIFNKNTPIDVLESIADKPNHPATRAYIDRALKAAKPDAHHKETVHAKFGTNKARKLRDMILESGKLEMRHKDLGNLAQGFKSGVNPKNGNLSAELLQQYIDSQPTARYNVSHDKWNGIQRHNDENSKVFQLNLTDEHVRQMQQAGVYGTFRKLQEEFTNSHPLKDHSIGWVRYTGKTRGKGKGIFIDEVQSDHAVPLAEKARTQRYRHEMNRHQRNAEEDHRIYKDEWDLHGAKGQPAPVDADEKTKERAQFVKDLYQKAHSEAGEAAQNAFEKANANYPAAHQKKINEILFGGKHSSEVLLEAFHQHLRDKGHVGIPVAIHSVHSKAAENLSDLEPGPDGKVDLSKVPGHYQKGYKQVPEAMQMEPATYAADNMATQDNPEHQGKPTYQQPLRKKTEEAAIFQWVAMVKAEKGVHGDGIDDDFGPEVEVKLPEHAIWAEYTKRKHD